MKLLKPKEASIVLNVSTQLLYLWRKDNIGPRYYKEGGYIRYKEEDLLEFLDNKLIKTNINGKNE